MGLALFEKYSCTSERKKHGLRPVYLRLSPLRAYEGIMEYLKKQEYKELTGERDFFDICYKNSGYEVSFLLGESPRGEAVVNLTVYGKHKRGRTRAKLKKEIAALRVQFADYVLN